MCCPEEITAVYLFLASDAASAILGEVISIGGSAKGGDW